MDLDVVVVGGGIAGSTLARVLSRAGKKVLVLERDAEFKDRVRGENIVPWGVATARRLGIVDDLVAAGAVPASFFNAYAMGHQTAKRPLPQTTPHGEGALNIYHPEMQAALLAAAVKSGVEVQRGAVVQSIEQKDGRWAVSYVENGKSHVVTPRVVVGADGRFSKMREWGGFTVKRDPEFLRIAGTILENANIPEDGIYLSFGPGFASFLAPLGNKRARAYFVYPGATGDRKLSGKEKIPAFMEGVRATFVPAEWLDGAQVTGPLAEFEGADQWVVSPAKRGLALIGDAAGASDPSWGCGLSKSFVDVENLSRRLLETDDWDAALEKYAADHDDMWMKLHRILGAMSELFWTPGPEADARRQRVMGNLEQNPFVYPDAIGLGPFGLADEKACALLVER
jgi:menaquinone-9 beta-reductase